MTRIVREKKSMSDKAALIAQHGRRTWDDKEYELKARQREEQAGDEDAMVTAPAGLACPAGSQRAYLNQGVNRAKGVKGMKAMKGQTRLVADAASRSHSGPGKWCAVCEVSLRDSRAWVDHINGQRHQKKLGFSMRVERSSTDDVASALSGALKRKASEKEGGGRKKFSAEAYKERIAVLKKKEEDEAEEKRARKRQRKEEAKASKAEAAPADTAGADAAMMAMMGFGGFGGSKKNS